eukprot:6114394-Amphidinium_carterae.1
METKAPPKMSPKKLQAIVKILSILVMAGTSVAPRVICANASTVDGSPRKKEAICIPQDRPLLGTNTARARTNWSKHSGESL